MRQFMAITKALADENRARTVMFLRHGELCLCQIMEMLRLAPSTVSKHMAVLQQAGLVEARKEGRWRYYRLPGKGAPALIKTTLRWVLSSLPEESRSTEDDRRLKAVLRKDINVLCALYRNGRRSSSAPAIRTAARWRKRLTIRREVPHVARSPVEV